MTNNKPGTVAQQPLFGCTSCYEDVSYPADHLHVYNGECWCESCWGEIADWRDWIKLETFRPALETDYERLQAETERLQAECEKLRSELDAHKAARIAYASEFPPDKDDQPDVGSIHQNIRKLKEECEKLRKDAEFGRSVLSKREPGKAYGCHCDLEEGMEPDGCVIDTNDRHNCVYAKDMSVKEQCEYWQVITTDTKREQVQ